MANWDQPQCEACWIEANGEFDLEPQADGVVQRLVSLRMPLVIAADFRHVERCAWCGSHTISGIYVRANPTTVPYPTP